MAEASKIDQFWEQAVAANRAIPPEVARLVVHTLRLLAGGEAVAAGQAADSAGLSQELAQTIFQQIKAAGAAEFDEQDRVTGLNGLSIRPTRVRFTVGGKNLYAWCAMDTLGLPYLLQQTAEVESECPVTKQPVKLTVSPEKVESAQPVGVVLSVVSPGAGLPSDCNPCDLAGTDGALCRNMHFFASTAAGETWLVEHEGANIVPVEEAHTFARRLYDSLEIPD